MQNGCDASVRYTIRHMTAVRVEVEGLRVALAELKKYDKTMYKVLEGKLKLGAQPLASKVGSSFPDKPLSKWHSSGGRKGKVNMPPYNGAASKRGVKPVVGIGRIKKVPSGSQRGILRIEQRNAGGAVYDRSGSMRPESQFVKNLDKHTSRKSEKGRTRSRTLFPKTKQNMAMIEREVDAALSVTNTLVANAILKG